jgi:hypothetical protein
MELDGAMWRRQYLNEVCGRGPGPQPTQRSCSVLVGACLLPTSVGEADHDNQQPCFPLPNPNPAPPLLPNVVAAPICLNRVTRFAPDPHPINPLSPPLSPRSTPPTSSSSARDRRHRSAPLFDATRPGWAAPQRRLRHWFAFASLDAARLLLILCDRVTPGWHSRSARAATTKNAFGLTRLRIRRPVCSSSSSRPRDARLALHQARATLGRPRALDPA